MGNKNVKYMHFDYSVPNAKLIVFLSMLNLNVTNGKMLLLE